MTLAVRAAAIVFCLCMACAGRTSPPPARHELSPSELYPLQTGNAWSYDVDTGEPSTTLAVTRVESFDGRVAEVRTGEAIVRYEVLDEGIRVLPNDEWLLRVPLEEGASWRARGGRSARLVSTRRSVETLAGRFEQCAEVAEAGGTLELEVRTIYCPGVGPVTLDSTMRSKLSDRALTVSARLRGYDVGPVTAAH